MPRQPDNADNILCSINYTLKSSWKETNAKDDKLLFSLMTFLLLRGQLLLTIKIFLINLLFIVKHWILLGCIIQPLVLKRTERFTGNATILTVMVTTTSWRSQWPASLTGRIVDVRSWDEPWSLFLQSWARVPAGPSRDACPRSFISSSRSRVLFQSFFFAYQDSRSRVLAFQI